jgi:ubiquinone/menaquinone biosynthesis C-methylase UbiE
MKTLSALVKRIPLFKGRKVTPAQTNSAGPRSVIEEESQRNQEEVNWWKNFIFKQFDSNPKNSEKKFLERFRGECTHRWQYICKEIKQDINFCAQGAVLDIGNGPCGLINFVPARIKVGIDPNNELYQRHNILYNVHADVVLLPSRAETIPLLDGTFDCITCVNVLDHTNDPMMIINEVYRLLKPGGIFWLSVDTRKPEETQLVHPHAISEEVVKEWTKAFKCLACRTDQPCYDGHPTNKRVDAWLRK